MSQASTLPQITSPYNLLRYATTPPAELPGYPPYVSLSLLAIVAFSPSSLSLYRSSSTPWPDHTILLTEE